MNDINKQIMNKNKLTIGININIQYKIYQYRFIFICFDFSLVFKLLYVNNLYVYVKFLVNQSNMINCIRHNTNPIKPINTVTICILNFLYFYLIKLIDIMYI